MIFISVDQITKEVIKVFGLEKSHQVFNVFKNLHRVIEPIEDKTLPKYYVIYNSKYFRKLGKFTIDNVDEPGFTTEKHVIYTAIARSFKYIFFGYLDKIYYATPQEVLDFANEKNCYYPKPDGEKGIGILCSHLKILIENQTVGGNYE